VKQIRGLNQGDAVGKSWKNESRAGAKQLARVKRFNFYKNKLRQQGRVSSKCLSKSASKTNGPPTKSSTILELHQHLPSIKPLHINTAVSDCGNASTSEAASIS
jgi:hypothetical protein